MPKDTSGTVRILMENVPDTDIVKSMVPDFNKDYPDVKIDIETLTYDQMRDKLVSSFQSSSPTYDLVDRRQPVDGRLRQREVPAAARCAHQQHPRLRRRRLLHSR